MPGHSVWKVKVSEGAVNGWDGLLKMRIQEYRAAVEL